MERVLISAFLSCHVSSVTTRCSTRPSQRAVATRGIISLAARTWPPWCATTKAVLISEFNNSVTCPFLLGFSLRRTYTDAGGNGGSVPRQRTRYSVTGRLLDRPSAASAIEEFSEWNPVSNFCKG